MEVAIILLFLWAYGATGQPSHQVIVTFQSYANPAGRCAECNGAIPTLPACCDAPFVVPQDQSCPIEDACDTALVYCYRAVGRTGTTCNFDQPIMAPQAVLNSGGFNSSSEFFGLTNPFVLDRYGPWTGFQILLVFHECFANPDSSCTVDFDLIIDSIPLNIDQPVGTSTPPTTYNGAADIVQVTASIEVRCTDGFFGPDCSTQCSNSEGCTGCGLSGFTGQFCQFSIEDCTDDYCNGHGNCTERSPFCDCEPGFTGDRCKTNIDDCVGVECNNSVCVDEIEGFRCECNAGFTGDRCEETIIDNCEGITCVRGTCVAEVDDFRCDCDAGFTGELCETNFDSCAEVNCNNGMCRNEAESFRCDCLPGFTGELCQETASSAGDATTGSVAGSVVGALAGTVLILVAIFMIVYLLVASRRSDGHVALRDQELTASDITSETTTTKPSNDKIKTEQENEQDSNTAKYLKVPTLDATTTPDDQQQLSSSYQQEREVVNHLYASLKEKPAEELATTAKHLQVPTLDATTAPNARPTTPDDQQLSSSYQQEREVLNHLYTSLKEKPADELATQEIAHYYSVIDSPPPSKTAFDKVTYDNMQPYEIMNDEDRDIIGTKL